MKKISTLIILLTIFGNSHAFITIGTDGACDTNPNNLQSKINDNSISEIRLTNQQDFGSIIIHNKSIIIIGGYNNCTDALNNDVSNTKSILLGNNNSSVIQISENLLNTHFDIYLENLEIKEGGGANGAGINMGFDVTVDLINLDIYKNHATNNGGGLYISGVENGIFTLSKLNIYDNSAIDDGGGIYLHQGASVSIISSNFELNTADNGAGVALIGGSTLTFNSATITNNTAAFRGGGIYSNASITYLTGKSSIDNNEALKGGGIAILAGKFITSSVGTQSLNQTIHGIHHNTAVNFGGGVFLESGAGLELVGDKNGYSNVTNNTLTAANSIGGGVYATANGTTVKAINARISGNTANSGGAISINDNANFQMKRSFGQCFGNQICSEIAKNSSNSAIITVENCATININQTEIYDNFSEIFGTVRLNGNLNSVCQSTFEGNIFHHNSKVDLTNQATLFYINSLAEIDFAFNTVTENKVNKIFLLSNTSGSSQTLNLNSSIIWNDPATIISESTPDNNTFSGNCLDLHDTTLPATFGNTIYGNDPLFNNAAAEDYSLTNMSPITDICSTSLYQPSAYDITGKVRGVGFSGAVLGDYDLGAFEHASVFPLPEIFLNGFE